MTFIFFVRQNKSKLLFCHKFIFVRKPICCSMGQTVWKWQHQAGVCRCLLHSDWLGTDNRWSVLLECVHWRLIFSHPSPIFLYSRIQGAKAFHPQINPLANSNKGFEVTIFYALMCNKYLNKGDHSCPWVSPLLSDWTRYPPA